MPRGLRRATAAALLVALGLAAPAYARDPQSARRARARLVAQSGGDARVSLDPATGVARFVAAAPGKHIGLARATGRAAGVPAKRGRAAEFFREYGALFGVSNAGAELEHTRVERDRAGGTRLVYRQRHRGLRVFAGELRVHFDAADELVAVNGRFVPVDPVDIAPARSAEEAGRSALATVAADAGAGGLEAKQTSLVVFREGVLRGEPGTTHLAWEVEVADGGGVRELVYVDAHTGKLVDRISRAPDALLRRAYDARGEAAPGPDYPQAPFWMEGDPFPTGVPEANGMLEATRETFELYSRAFGRDSFDGAGAVLDAIFDRGDGCPNASWNGLFASFCPGMAADDVTAHEWSHAYTEHTHGLIYQWQPGALNEAYSAIFGEVVALLNGRGRDVPGARRSDSEFPSLPARLVAQARQRVAGARGCGGARFNPESFDVTGQVAAARDGGDAPSDGCSPLVNPGELSGRIAVVDRGGCRFVEKVAN